MGKLYTTRPTMLGIIERDGAFHWSISFAGDPRLPLMGDANSFDKALQACRRAIKTINDNGPIATVDRSPAAAQ